jgi:hypothetical protein
MACTRSTDPIEPMYRANKRRNGVRSLAACITATSVATWLKFRNPDSLPSHEGAASGDKSGPRFIPAAVGLLSQFNQDLAAKSFRIGHARPGMFNDLRDDDVGQGFTRLTVEMKHRAYLMESAAHGFYVFRTHLMF